jgi:TolA-binding protein
LIIGITVLVLATTWTAFVVDTIVESTRAFEGSILFLDRTLLTPGVRPGILLLCGLAASAGLAWTGAIAYVRGRRLRKRTAREVATRVQEVKVKAAGDAARAGLTQWRMTELQASIDELTEQRDQIVAEMDLARKRTSELRALSEDYQRSVTKLQDQLIKLPAGEDELAQRRSQR